MVVVVVTVAVIVAVVDQLSLMALITGAIGANLG